MQWILHSKNSSGDDVNKILKKNQWRWKWDGIKIKYSFLLFSKDKGEGQILYKSS